MPDDSRAINSQAGGAAELANLQRLFALQKKAAASSPTAAYEERIANLDRIIHLIEVNEKAIIDAVSADFGHRATEETIIAEIMVTVSGAKGAKSHLKRWMRPRKITTPLHMQPAKSQLLPEPLGVVGVISPWNYPVQLALAPAVAALAAGNRVLIKPSELSPRTSELLAEMVSKAFDPSVMAVVTGGVDTGKAFSSLAFDHLVFTGSTAVGKIVYAAAAKNLTPVTLELGGKSPAIIDESANIAKTTKSIAYGKMLNAGQTCVAPDYVLAPKANTQSVAEGLTNAARALFPDIDTTDDYTSIVADRHFDRLKAMVEEARDMGAQVIEVGSANALHPQRKIPFTLIIDPPKEARVMKEEIFGPILLVLSVEDEDAAIDHINAGDKPLALYWFGADSGARDEMLGRTSSGGVTVNDVIWHVAQENLPFGGVGMSGIGAYHGQAGFDNLSHLKPVFHQSKLASAALLYPPYTDKTAKLLKTLRKFI